MARGGWPRLGVGAVVLRDGMVLLVKRRYPPFPGLWSIPGGHVEPGETVFEAAARELLEETGVTGRPRSLVDVHELIIYGEDGELEAHYLIVDVLLEYVSGEPRASSDALDARFVELGSGGRVGVEVTPTVAKLLRKLAKGSYPALVPERTICRGLSCS